MRLICPNCDAQYEVPDDAIPDTGRDVQCSDCGHTWFQSPAPIATADESDEFERQPIPSEVSDILQEEAQFEMDARAREQDAFGELADEDGQFADDASEDTAEFDLPETEAEPLAENNPFAVDPDPEEPEETDAERRAREARQRMERMRGVEANNPFSAASDSRQSALPDVDAINSSLSPDGEHERRQHAIDLEDLNRINRRGSGFRTGFTLMVFLGLMIIAIYITHENIARALPFAGPALDAFADQLDQARFWVEDEAALRLDQLQGLVDDILNGG